MSGKVVITIAGGVAVLNLLSLAVIDPTPGFAIELFLGYFVGSLFGQAALASAWMGLGLGDPLKRAGVSLGWIALLPIIASINIAINGGPMGRAAMMLTVCFVALWAVLSMLLITFKFVTGTEIVSTKHREQSVGIRQLRMRDLFILMTVAAVLVGGAKLLIQRADSMTGETPIFAFLAGATVLFIAPLIVSTLLERFYVIAVMLSLAMIATLTFWETDLLTAIGGGSGRPRFWDFVFINTFSASLVLIVLSLIRSAGYCLPVGRPLVAADLVEDPT